MAEVEKNRATETNRLTRLQIGYTYTGMAAKQIIVSARLDRHQMAALRRWAKEWQHTQSWVIGKLIDAERDRQTLSALDEDRD